ASNVPESQTLTFYRGTTISSAIEIIESQEIHVGRILGHQLLDAYPVNRQGVYLTSQQWTAEYWAQLAAHVGQRRGWGPAVVKIEVPAKNFNLFAQQFNIPIEVPIPNSPLPGMTETLLPFHSVPEFNGIAEFNWNW